MLKCHKRTISISPETMIGVGEATTPQAFWLLSYAICYTIAREAFNYLNFENFDMVAHYTVSVW